MSQSTPDPIDPGASSPSPPSSPDSTIKSPTPREIRDHALAKGFKGRAWFLPYEEQALTGPHEDWRVPVEPKPK